MLIIEKKEGEKNRTNYKTPSTKRREQIQKVKYKDQYLLDKKK